MVDITPWLTSRRFSGVPGASFCCHCFCRTCTPHLRHPAPPQSYPRLKHQRCQPPSKDGLPDLDTVSGRRQQGGYIIWCSGREREHIDIVIFFSRKRSVWGLPVVVECIFKWFMQQWVRWCGFFSATSALMAVEALLVYVRYDRACV